MSVSPTLRHKRPHHVFVGTGYVLAGKLGAAGTFFSQCAHIQIVDQPLGRPQRSVVGTFLAHLSPKRIADLGKRQMNVGRTVERVLALVLGERVGIAAHEVALVKPHELFGLASSVEERHHVVAAVGDVLLELFLVVVFFGSNIVRRLQHGDIIPKPLERCVGLRAVDLEERFKPLQLQRAAALDRFLGGRVSGRYILERSVGHIVDGFAYRSLLAVEHLVAVAENVFNHLLRFGRQRLVAGTERRIHLDLVLRVLGQP